MGHPLAKTARILIRYAEQHGWQHDRYFGFDPDGAAAVMSHYSEANDPFARRMLNCSWRERVPMRKPIVKILLGN